MVHGCEAAEKYTLSVQFRSGGLGCSKDLVGIILDGNILTNQHGNWHFVTTMKNAVSVTFLVTITKCLIENNIREEGS